MKIYQKAKDKNVGAKVFYFGQGQKTELTETGALNIYLFENEQDAESSFVTKDVSKAITCEELKLAYLAGNMVIEMNNGALVRPQQLVYDELDNPDVFRLDVTCSDIVQELTVAFTIRGREFDIDEADTDDLEPTE